MSGKLVNEFYAFLKDREFEDLSDIFEENASVFFPGVSNSSGIYMGRDKIKRFFKKLISLVPDLHFETVRIIASASFACVEWSASGNTRRGGLVLKTGVSVFEFGSEGIISMNNYISSGKLM